MDEAPQRFARAFDRWRDLLVAAGRRVDDAARALRDYSISPQERRAAEMRQAAGNTQTKLLLRGWGPRAPTSASMATGHGRLFAGYNFPACRSWHSCRARAAAGRALYPARPFPCHLRVGPYSLVYLEGRAYRVVRALLKEAGSGPHGGSLPSAPPSARCAVPGAKVRRPRNVTSAVARSQRPTSSPSCTGSKTLGRARPSILPANDEDRRRQGLDLQTTFSFGPGPGRRHQRAGRPRGAVLPAGFGAAALVRRINKGLRRRRSESEIGFWIESQVRLLGGRRRRRGGRRDLTNRGAAARRAHGGGP